MKTVKIRPKNTLSVSKAHEMTKTTKVKVLKGTVASNGGTTPKSFAANNGHQDDKTRRLLKLLFLFCLGQAIVVIAAGTVFGILLAAKIKDIHTLKQQSGKYQETIQQFEVFQQLPSSPSITSVLSTLENIGLNQTNIIHDLHDLHNRLNEHDSYVRLNLDENVAQLGVLTYAHNESLHELDSRLTLLEEKKKLQDSRITELEMNTDANDNFETNISARMSVLELAHTSFEETLYNSTVKIGKLDILLNGKTFAQDNTTAVQIETLEEFSIVARALLQNQTTQVQQLESELGEILGQNNATADQINSLEEFSIVTAAILQNQSTQIQRIESEIAARKVISKYHGDTIAQLLMETLLMNASLHKYSLRLQDIESDQGGSSLENISRQITDLEHSRQGQSSTDQAQTAQLLDLERDVNLTQQDLQTYIATLTGLIVSLNCTWEDWSSFSFCSHTCGEGSKYRTRRCMGTSPADHNWIPRTETDIQPCTIQTCPVNGNWGDWTSYSVCSSSCGGGTQTRQRSCDSPAPSNGGDACSGIGEETQACNAISCQVHGGWGIWTDTSDCSRSCDGGLRYRIRMCNNPSPSFGGDWCSGSGTDYQSCNTGACPNYRSAFTVYSPQNGPEASTIRFENEINNFGSHYDTSTGKFTCEYPGIYMFHLHIITDNGAQWAACYIRYNGRDMVYAEADPADDDTHIYGNYGTSNSVILKLAVGDVVDLGGCTDYSSMDAMFKGTTFSGFLLYHF